MLRRALPAFVALACASSVQAQEMDYFNFTMENDIAFSEDGGYTNGIGGSWGYLEQDSLSDENLPSWINWLQQLTPLQQAGRQYQIDYGIGQAMQTAINIELENPPLEDAPYAGALLWNVGLTGYDDKVADRFKLTLGWIGPASGAEKAQKIVHELTGSKEPKGWDTQLENEIVFAVEAERQWRMAAVDFGNGTELDVIGTVHGGLGNWRSEVGGGFGLRWGQNLAASFASHSLIPNRGAGTLNGKENGWQLFANIGGAWVANDIFLDGNTFNDSRSVDIIHEQAYVTLGGSVDLGNWTLGITFLEGTDRYETQTEGTRFSSFNVGYSFD